MKKQNDTSVKQLNESKDFLNLEVALFQKLFRKELTVIDSYLKSRELLGNLIYTFDDDLNKKVDITKENFNDSSFLVWFRSLKDLFQFVDSLLPMYQVFLAEMDFAQKEEKTDEEKNFIN